MSVRHRRIIFYISNILISFMIITVKSVSLPCKPLFLAVPFVKVFCCKEIKGLCYSEAEISGRDGATHTRDQNCLLFYVTLICKLAISDFELFFLSKL